jgi:replicative superfamily II helicase
MNEILNRWMNDAEAFEMQKLYNISKPQEYEFTARQGDFYITLLNRMYDILQGVDNMDYEVKTEELVDVAQAMLVYSEQASEMYFNGIDKVSNHLYVAAIYFLVRYEAVASCILRGCNINDYKTGAAQLIYYIVSGGACDINKIENESAKKDVIQLSSFIHSGNGELNTFQAKVEAKFNKFQFDSLDDFFDTALLLHVTRKISKTNLWSVLTTAAPDMNWAPYIEYSFSQHILSFLPSQEDAINKGLLKFKKAFSLKMPTSAGKSYITELIIYQELMMNKNAKVLYLAPLRSLSRELKLRFEKVGHSLGFTSRAIYGGNTFTIDQDIVEEAQLLISTPETFTSMEDTLEEQLTKFSLVICDEGQLLDSLKRGINYELLLTRLKKIDNVRYLFLSAIIPNIEDVNTWLGGERQEVGDSNYRPCPIKLACIQSGFDIVVKSEDYITDKYVVNGFLSRIESRGVGSSQKAKASALALKSVSAGPVMLFTAVKSGNKGCVSIGEEIHKILNLGHLHPPLYKSSNPDKLKAIASYIAYQFGDEHPLFHFIRNGYAYHHGSLPQDIREVLEQNYVDKVIPLLICTSTLAEGVNLPVQTLILYCLSRYNYSTENVDVLDRTEIKNIVGRAGRAGKQRFGIVIYPDSDLSKQSYRNVVEALQNVGLHPIMGTLYDIVRIFDRFREQLNDNGINRLIEENGLASAIDTMITRSIKIDSLESIDIEEIVKESLAYHVGSADIRKQLKRVFRIRYQVISEKLNQDNFPTFRDTGMTVDNIVKATELITTDSLAAIDLTTPLSESWIDFAIATILQFPNFENGEIGENQEKRKLNNVEIKSLLSTWINGKQYYEIAEKLNCNVDNAIDLVMFLQNSFHMNASSLVRYIKTIGLNTTAIEMWIDMIKHGVNSEQKLLLIRSGLADRILVNALLTTTLIENLNFENAHTLRSSMKHFREKVQSVAIAASLPILCMERLSEYLK